MGKFKAFLKWSSLFGIAMVLVLAAAGTLSRAFYPTEAQREAIARMAQQPEYDGKNAFALLWTLERDVPEEELSAVMAEEIRRFTGQAAAADDDGNALADIVSAAEAYPDLSPGREDRNLFCDPIDEDCLSQVRGNLDTYADLVDRNEKLLDRIERLHEYDFLRSPFPHEMRPVLLPFRTTTFLQTRRAVQFASGQEEHAVAATCRDIATWRRLGSRSDNLVARSVAMAYATEQSGRALAQMLAEWPLERPLPVPCREALAAPALAELSLCNTLRGEFAAAARSTRELNESVDRGSLIDRMLNTVVFDAEATVGLLAETAAEFCGDNEWAPSRADRGRIPEPAQPSLLRFACIGNPAGCITHSISRPDYSAYWSRLQDYSARLRVLGSLAWMRRQADEGRSAPELLAARPEALRSPTHEIEFGPDGNTLRIPPHGSAGIDYWSIPLPPSLSTAAGD
jgi:hypothetical protein